jgi:electron transport complex protein RnfG
LISALALAAIHELTEEPIEEQKRLAIMRAVQEVLPPFDNDPVQTTRQIVLEEDEVGAEDETTVYLGTLEDQITGIAFQAYGEGYAGFIYVMVGIDLEERISGIKVLDHEETPGLGAKIEEPSFTDQLKGKSLDNSVLVNGNLAVKKDGGDLDALTGATISPRGVAQAASAALKIFSRHRRQILGPDLEPDSSAAPTTQPCEAESEDTTAEQSSSEDQKR